MSDVVARHAAPALRCPAHTVDSAAGPVLAAVHKLVGDAGHRAVMVALRGQQLQQSRAGPPHVNSSSDSTAERVTVTVPFILINTCMSRILLPVKM